MYDGIVLRHNMIRRVSKFVELQEVSNQAHLACMRHFHVGSSYFLPSSNPPLGHFHLVNVYIGMRCQN